ncbi:MAG: outer membrane beta-barrel protein [Candidatus Sulfotelmatobacter sp.]
MRKFALLASACVALLFTSIASAQQGDIMVGGGTLMSSSPNNDSVSFHPPTEKGGTYVHIGGDYIRFKHRLGFNAETAWRDKRVNYPDTGETYRPFFTDFNALYAPHIRKKIDLDLFAGIGVATYRFNVPDVTSCSIPTGGCTFYTSSNHFMEDLGGGVRYYVWHHFPHILVRPEVHYYHIQKNIEFTSSNVFRVGVSVGYTIGH